MKRFLSIFICGLILGVGIAKAQDASTTSAEVRGPWMNIISTETGFVPPVSSENRGASLWQSTNILVGYRINEDYSVSFLQGISNSFFDTGVSENGAYSLEHTILGISRKNLGEIAGADLSARLGALIPTGRLTEDENKMGLLGSLEPSIKGSKTWGRWSLETSLAQRVSFYEKETWDEYRYASKDAKAKTYMGPRTNSPTRSIVTLIPKFQVIDKLALGVELQYEVDWRFGENLPHHRAIVTPEVSYDVIDNLTLAAGYAWGRRPGGSASEISNYWLHDPSLDHNSTAYFNVSYIF